MSGIGRYTLFNPTNDSDAGVIMEVKCAGSLAQAPIYRMSTLGSISVAMGLESDGSALRIVGSTVDNVTLGSALTQCMIISQPGVKASTSVIFPNLLTVVNQVGASSCTVSANNVLGTSGVNSTVRAQSTVAPGGDVRFHWSGGGGTNWYGGVYRTDGDIWYLTNGASAWPPSSTRNRIVARANGAVTFPTSPAFLAYLGTNDANVTGDGTTFKLGSGNALTEVFDQGGDFVTTGTFTAPTTGRYYLCASIVFSSLSAAVTAGTIKLITSNGTYCINQSNLGAERDSTNFLVLNGGAFVDMDASDTAYINLSASGTTKTVGVLSSLRQTMFGGFLQC